jgi:hypothetical protein
MSPDEDKLLNDLFDRVQSAARTPRDRDAEDLIAQRLREQPYSAYYLAQAVIVQDQALKNTTNHIQELEEQVRRLQSNTATSQPESGGFLGGLGSLFGSRSSQTTPARDAYTQREGGLYDDYARTNRMPEQEPGPWGRNGTPGPWGAQPAAPSPGGGFLHGALTTAAGVAGGVLAADAIRSMFSSHLGGTAANLGGLGNFGNTPVEETVVNNFFGDNDRSSDRDAATGGGGSVGSSQDDNDDNNDDDFDTADFGGDDDSFA